MSKPIAGVMGAGEGASQRERDIAFQLGQLLARDGWIVLSGGRNAGVMREVNRGAKSIPGSTTVGILPSAQSEISPDVDIPIITEMHNARNNINVLSSRVIIACGNGGAGTASEIALALKAGKPVILLGHDELSVSFFKRLGGDRVIAVESPEQAVDAARRFKQ